MMARQSTATMTATPVEMLCSSWNTETPLIVTATMMWTKRTSRHSSGVPAGRGYLPIRIANEYPEPATLLLLALGGLAAMRRLVCC